MQLQRHADEVAQKQIAVAVVTFEEPWRAQAYAEETALPWPLLIDSERTLYSKFGMKRGSKRRVLGLRSWLVYLKLVLRGHKLRRSTGDILQLGGDVLIDPQGIVQMHHVGQDPSDRPSISSLFAKVDVCRQNRA